MKSDKYKEFFDLIWREVCSDTCFRDVSEFIEEYAEKAGLVEEVPYNPDVHGQLEDTEIGDMIYVRKDRI